MQSAIPLRRLIWRPLGFLGLAMGLIVSAVGGSIGCSSSGSPTPRSCLIDQDCQSNEFCYATAIQRSDICSETPMGTCTSIDWSADGKPCTSDEDCRANGLVCLVGMCAIDSCLVLTSTIFCDSHGCPDAGPGTVVVTCAGSDCRAGTRRESCETCFCLSCALDASTTSDAPVRDGEGGDAHLDRQAD